MWRHKKIKTENQKVIISWNKCHEEKWQKTERQHGKVSMLFATLLGKTGRGNNAREMERESHGVGTWALEPISTLSLTSFMTLDVPLNSILAIFLVVKWC